MRWRNIPYRIVAHLPPTVWMTKTTTLASPPHQHANAIHPPPKHRHSLLSIASSTCRISTLLFVSQSPTVAPDNTARSDTMAPGKPFACVVCGASFGKSTGLQVHCSSLEACSKSAPQMAPGKRGKSPQASDCLDLSTPPKRACRKLTQDDGNFNASTPSSSSLLSALSPSTESGFLSTPSVGLPTPQLSEFEHHPRNVGIILQKLKERQIQELDEEDTSSVDSAPVFEIACPPSFHAGVASHQNAQELDSSGSNIRQETKTDSVRLREIGAVLGVVMPIHPEEEFDVPSMVDSKVISMTRLMQVCCNSSAPL